MWAEAPMPFPVLLNDMNGQAFVEVDLGQSEDLIKVEFNTKGATEVVLMLFSGAQMVFSEKVMCKFCIISV